MLLKFWEHVNFQTWPGKGRNEERGEKGERKRVGERERERELEEEVSACLARCRGDCRRGRGYRDRHLWPANFSLSGNQSTVARQWLMLLLLLLLLLLVLLLAGCSKVLAAPASPSEHSRLCSPGEILIYSLSFGSARLARPSLSRANLISDFDNMSSE